MITIKIIILKLGRFLTQKKGQDPVYFCVLKVFLKKFNFFICFKLIFFILFSDYFNILMSKIIYKK